MKTLGPLLCCFLWICLSSETLAQSQSTLPPQAKQDSSVSEIVGRLDKTILSHARISLVFEGAESYLDGSDPMQSIAVSTSRLSEELFFSSGFRLVSVDGCRLTLKNDQVKILSWGTSSNDRHVMSFADFLFEGKKGEKKLTPQSGVLFIPLDKLSYKGGRKPYRYTKNRDTEKLLGTWRTEFKEKGFFRRRPLEMQITSAEGANLKSKMNAETLTFTFDDKEESESFNVAFRQAIKLCTAK